MTVNVSYVRFRVKIIQLCSSFSPFFAVTIFAFFFLITFFSSFFCLFVDFCLSDLYLIFFLNFTSFLPHGPIKSLVFLIYYYVFLGGGYRSIHVY